MKFVLDVTREDGDYVAKVWSLGNPGSDELVFKSVCPSKQVTIAMLQLFRHGVIQQDPTFEVAAHAGLRELLEFEKAY